MARVEMDIDTALPPDRVIAALTDFSERRPQMWPDLAPEYYEVYEVGDTWAEVREGSTKPMKVWARERYDWSTPGTVTWTVRESNFCAPESFVSARVSPAAHGGSRVHLVWERVGTTLKGKFVVAMIRMAKGKPVASSVKKSLDAMAQRPG